MERAVIHLNVADFAVAVERQCDSRLRQRPVIIAAPTDNRAAVYDMSDEAYQNGIRKGMSVGQARRLCREAILVPPNPRLYQRASRAFFATALPFSPLVEAVDSNGHLFIDVTRSRKLFGPPTDIAHRLRSNARRDLGIEPIWSLASNKLLAKVASRLVKPLGEYVINDGEEEKTLSPCPLALLPGIEHRDILRLQDFNITCVGQLATLSSAQLALHFGSFRGSYLHDLAHGIDFSPVLPAGGEPPSILENWQFTGGSNDRQEVEQALFHLSERAGRRLRKCQKATGRITVTLRYSDQLSLNRRTNCPAPTAGDATLFSLARKLLQTAWHRRIRLLELQLACQRLTAFPPLQISLFTEKQKDNKNETLLSTLDAIRRRFGSDSIKWGRMKSSFKTQKSCF